MYSISPTIKRLTLVVLFLVTISGLSSSAWAEEDIAFNFNNADIRSVIKSVARITGKNFIIDPRVTGEVTIVSSQTMAAADLYSVFLSVLQVHGYTAIEAGNIVKILPDALARQELSAAPVDQLGASPGDQSITKIYKLNYVPADQMVGILRPLVASTSYLAAHKQSNMLIMVDRAANINRLVKIIERIDQATSGETEIIHIQHATAAELVSVIATLEGKSDRKTGENLHLIADERTNSILLSGDAHDVLRAKALIAHLDTPSENEGSTQVVFLRYAKATDMVPILTGIIKGESSPDTATQSGSVQVTIQADEGNNALIITAPPLQMKSLQSVVAKLDIRRAQLMIEAVIAEVSMDNSAELGVQWRSTSEVGNDHTSVIGGTNFNAAGSGINQISANPAIIGDGLSLGFLKGTTYIEGIGEILNLGALLRVLAQTGDANILSTPSLMTLDNEEAEIIVGQNVPFPTGSYTSAGSTNSSVNPFTTYERHDVGIKLKVKPQINEGDTIRLMITQEVSSVVSMDQSAGPTTNTRSITTSVLVDDGKLLVLGGLISDDIQEIEQRVPVLGSIPLLGLLFRYNSRKHVKRNLMVFLRPVIIRDTGVSSSITYDKYDYMRGLQQDYGENQSSLMPDEQGPILPPAGPEDGAVDSE
ncbi:MAG: type II secretion system secretin GspD [Desulfobulbaceae bacterium]|jgi:general secretion pathway protein D|nr:type II secretion system secretin GspD [Desulfobulbaceae bacterium]